MLAALKEKVKILLGCSLGKAIEDEIKRLVNMGMEEAVIVKAAIETIEHEPEKNILGYYRRILQRYEQDKIWKSSDFPKRKNAPVSFSDNNNSAIDHYTKEVD